MKFKAWLVVTWLGGLTSATLLHTALADTAQIPATLLLWQEQEAGVAPYQSRMLVTDHYLRSDDGRDDADFMLFDRKSQRIYSVAHAQHSILVIDAGRVPASAGPRPSVEVLLQPDPEAPKIGGRTVSHFQLYTGRQECLQATIVPGLLPEAVAAMREMQTVLAGRQYRDMDKTPEEYRTACFLVNYVYDIDRHLQAGMPIRELREDGRQRVLLDYRTGETVSPDLFRLPQGYTEEKVP